MTNNLKAERTLTAEELQKAIMLEIQCYDFGRTDPETGNFTCSASQIDLLEERCKAAADRILRLQSLSTQQPMGEPVAWEVCFLGQTAFATSNEAVKRNCEDSGGTVSELIYREAQEKLIEELEGYLARIAEMDEVDAALDPTHAIRIAGAARRLIRSQASKSNPNTPERNDE